MAEKRKTPRTKGREISAGSASRLGRLKSKSAESNDKAAGLCRQLEKLAKTAREVRQAEGTIAKLGQELEYRTLRAERQLVVARQFQRLFMPPSLPSFPQVRFAVKYKPSPAVGGDLYDVCDMGNSSVGILIADASGSGLTATLVTAVAKMAFDTFRQSEYSPKIILEKMNHQILLNSLEDQFLTAFLAVLDLETLRMKYVNASHPCPILFSPRKFELLDTEGLCCGMFEDARYEEREIQLHEGDRMLLYTRGLVRMVNTKGRSYGSSRLHKLLKRNSRLDLDAALELVEKETKKNFAGVDLTDDLTLLGFEVLPRETKEERIVIASEPMQLARVESSILSKLEELNYGERTIFAVRLAVEEAVINAIKHGNKMDKAKRVAITFSADKKECVISVEDEGKGFNVGAVPDPTADENLELAHGRGLVLMRAYMDEVSYNAKGNKVTMRKKTPWT